jgi:hypothetical protein
MWAPEWLQTTLSEAAALIRSSDTVTWLTTDAASHLATRATEREEEIIEIRDALFRADPNRIPHFDGAVRFATAEAAMQRKLADWLKGLAPMKKGDD